MSPKPIIFLSTVSRELRSARQLVANTLTMLGYEPEWQDIFGTEQGDLRAMLRRRIDASVGVVQLVGKCYGAEPPTPDEEFGRVSYTQYEALYARKRGKKVWVLFLDAGFPVDACDPEPEEKAEFQRAYRAKLEAGDDLYVPLKSTEGLEASVFKLRDDLARLRRGVKQWSALVLALLILSVGLGAWMVKGGRNTQQKLEVTDKKLAVIQDQMAQLLRQGVNAYPGIQAKVQQQAPRGQKQDETDERTYDALAKQLGVDARVLREKLPAFARELQRSADATPLERANAAYVDDNDAEAERLALLAADEALKAAPPRIAEAIEARELAGLSAEAQIQYTRALDHFHAAAALTHRERDPVEWARVQDELAGVLLEQGKSAEAEPILREVIAVRTKVLGEEDADTLSSRHDLANALEGQSKNVEAEQEHRAVLAIRARVLGGEDPDFLASRTYLANSLYKQGNYTEAEKEYRVLLAIHERLLGPEDPDTLISRNNLANALQAQGKSAEAEDEHRKILAIRARDLGEDDLDTLISRHNLASALQAQGKSAEAETEYRKVIAIRTRMLGEEHPDTLVSRFNLARALMAQGNNVEAEKEYRATLAASTKVRGAEHFDTLACWNNLANVLDDEQKYEEAEKEHRAVLAIRLRVLGAENRETLRSRNNLARVLGNENKYAEADAQYRAVLAAREHVLGAEHPDTLWTRNDLADALTSQGKHAEAEKELRGVLAIRERVLDANDPDLSRSCYNLARCLGVERKYKEAIELAQRAESGWRRELGDEDSSYRRAVALLKNLQAESRKPTKRR